MAFPFPKLSGNEKDIGDAFAGNESPKLKFNFSVMFKFRAGSPMYQGEEDPFTNQFAVKTVGRIKPSITYQDINFYNFRTKVATKAEFNVFDMMFYDDSVNRAHDIFETYMALVSPITTIGNANGLPGSSTIGPLPGGSELGLIEEIVLSHYHINGKTDYKYFNPKITEINLDELDMTISDTTTVGISFNFDTYFIERQGR